MTRYIDGPSGDFAAEMGDGWWKLVRSGVTVACFHAADDAAVIARLAERLSDYEVRTISRDRRRAWLRDLASVNTTAAAIYAAEFGHLGR